MIHALSTGISPFVGQNYGAGHLDRVRHGINLANRFCLLWGGFLLLVFALCGRPLAAAFDSNPDVVASASRYLWIVAISLGLRGVHNTIWTALNVLERPYDAMALELLLAFVLWIPLAILGGRYAGVIGVYVGLSLSNVLAGLAAAFWCRRLLNQMQKTGQKEH